MALLKKLLPEPILPTAHACYIALVERARNPFFYESLRVPDTLDGRFELIVLHLFLIQYRLVAETDPAAVEFSRQLGEIFLMDMDHSLREIGVSDTGVRRRMKAMGKAYHGRLQVYAQAAGDAEALLSALARNLYGTVAEGDVAVLARMAAYIRTTQAALHALSTEALCRGEWEWPTIA